MSKPYEELPLETLVRHALARAYCAPCNANKELDHELVEEMIKEVIAIPVFVHAVRRRDGIE